MHTEDTMAQLWANTRKAANAGLSMLPPELQKAISTATGLTWYDLEPYAKLLFPVITPLRNEIPRVAGSGDTATHWKTITAINTMNLSFGLSEGHRGGSVTTQVNDMMAAYKSFGLDDSVTFEADLAAKNFDDVKQLAVNNLLRAVMISEEQCIVGGNASLALGTTPTPTVADVTTGGALLANTAYRVIAVALTLDGYLNASVANGVPAVIVRTNTDGSSSTYGGGSAQKSAAAAVTTANDGLTTHRVTASVTAVNGAVAYAWFMGIGAGNERLAAITTINSVSLTANPTTTQLASALPASDNSRNALVFDGLLTQILTPGSGAYVVALATGTAGTGTPLTSDGAGGIVEIDAAFKSFWDSAKLSPQALLVNSQELRTITKVAIANGSAPLFRFVGDMQGKSSVDGLTLTAGAVVGTYLNKYTMNGGQLVQVLLHPNVPPGTIIFYSRTIPYPLSNVKNLLQMKMQRDYFQIEWPQVRPAWEYSVWARGLLQNYFLPAFGVIQNIGASA
jgi:hypothetical protein